MFSFTLSSSFVIAALPFLASALPTAHVESRDISLPGSWASLGCYADSVDDRTLSASSTSSVSMSASACISYCQGQGYVYAGTEYSQQCFCSNFINPLGLVVDAGQCNMPCAGDATQNCGGAGAVNIYYSGQTAPNAPSTAQTVGDWNYVGCYSDSVGARTLVNQVGTSGGVSSETCTAACQAAGYSLAGTEYADECYCGNDFSNGGAPADGGCNMVCAGDSSEYCGGSNRLNVYRHNSASTSSSTTSGTSTGTDTTTSTSTSESGTTSSSSTDGTSTSTSSSTDPTTTTSSSPTTSSSSTSSSPSSTASSPTSSGSSTSSTSTTSTSTPSPSSAANWQSLGCYSVGSVNLAKGVKMSDANTVASCENSCYNAGYSYAGVLFNQQCYCYPTASKTNGALNFVVDALCNVCTGLSGNSLMSAVCSKMDSFLHLYQYNGVVPAAATSKTTTSSSTSTTPAKTSSTSSTTKTTSTSTSTTSAKTTPPKSTATSTSKNNIWW